MKRETKWRSIRHPHWAEKAVAVDLQKINKPLMLSISGCYFTR